MSDVLEALEAQREPLFALLDAGRDPEILTLLYSHDAVMRSLYQGDAEAELGRSGPYLAAVEPDSELLATLLKKGWGHAWGVYLTSPASFDEVRKYFRSLLMVRREKDGSEMYFRFYDPRVLRIFLPTCSDKQLEQMFGPVTAFLVEGDEGQMLRMSPKDGEIAVEEIARA